MKTSLSEQLGYNVGLHTLKGMFDSFAKEAKEKFNVKVHGKHNLEIAHTNPVIIAVNHIGPKHLENKFIPRSSGLTPDVLLIQNTFEEITGKIPKTAAILATPPELKSFGAGLMRGGGTIPVDKTAGAFNRSFIKESQQAFQNGDSLVLYIEGKWRTPNHDYSKEIDVQPGAAHLSTHFDVPIIPTYILCPDNWDNPADVQIAFGKPLMPSDFTNKDELSDQIGSSIIELQKMVNESLQ